MNPLIQEQDAQRWREKYLNSLDEIEALEHELTQQIQTIAQGFIHISRLAKGQDPALDQQLDTLRKQLQHNSPDKTLRGTIASLEDNVSRIRENQLETQEQIIQTIEHTLTQLHELELPRDIKRQLRDYRKTLQQKAENFYRLPEILTEFSHIQYNITQTLSTITKPRGSLFGKLFGQRKQLSAPPDKDPLDLETAIKPHATLEHKPIINATTKPQSPPITQSAAENPAPTPQHTDPATIVGHDLAEQISDVLHSMLYKIPMPDNFLSNKKALEARLQKTTEAGQLLGMLDEISELLFTILEQEQQELRDFLSTINQRLTEVGAFLKKTLEHQQHTAEHNHSMDQQVRSHLNNIETHIHTADDLSDLKKSIRGHLDEITSTLSYYREQEKQQSYSLTHQLQGLIERVQQMEIESKDTLEKLEEQKQTALRDPLTGLPNRYAYNEHLRHEHARWKRYATPLCIAIGDIDYFKQINDNYGHLAGDKVLQAISSIMQTALRDTDFIARFGGEEFVIVLPNTITADALQAVEKLRNAVEQCPFHYRKKPVKLTISFGISEFIHPNDNSESVLERADRALYKAKQNGRNRTEVDAQTAQSIKTTDFKKT